MAVIHFNEEGFKRVVSEAPVAMVDFWADWCGPCKMLGPTIDKLGAQYEGRAVIGKVNVDDEGGLAASFGVMSIPTVIFFRNGKEVDRKVGLMPAGVYSDTLDALLG